MSIVDINHACAFTGHRPEKLDASEEEVKTWLEEKINDAINDGYTDFITGMQRGVDLWAAEILVNLKREGIPIRIIAACAFKGMENRWDNSWKKTYNHVLKFADEINTIGKYPGKAAFFLRDEWMVDHASRLIAVYTGASGGTKKTVDYARKKGIEVVSYLHKSIKG